MTIPTVPWAQHLAGLDWNQGEHILIAGPTGTGKTTLAADLVKRRGHVITFATKQRDDVLDDLYADWSEVSSAREIEPWMNRVVVRPKLGRREPKTMASIKALHRRTFPDVFDYIYKDTNWCVLVDETLYMTDKKYGNSESQIEMMHYHGRSAGISMVCLTQRPAWIPKILYSSASHAYIAKTADVADLRRLSELANVNPRELASSVSALPSRFDWVYTPSLGQGSPAQVNTRK